MGPDPGYWSNGILGLVHLFSSVNSDRLLLIQPKVTHALFSKCCLEQYAAAEQWNVHGVL